MAYYQEDIECLEHSKLKEEQNKKFLKQIKHVFDNVPYYANKMKENGVSLEDIKSIDDLHKLPFMAKEDLRITYPDGLLATDKKNCIRIHSTSGTTGKRVIVFYTKNDLDIWNDCTARALSAAGVTNEDVCQIAYGYGLFTGGMGLHGGSEKLGCLTIPMSSGNTDRQLQFMEDLGTTVLCCTPSYAAYLAENISEREALEKLKLRVGIFGGEAWTKEMRDDIEKTLHIKAFDIYGLTEVTGPGVAFDCEEHDGLHINEDHFYPEIIDPNTLEVLKEGEKGELVFTSLDKEAFPLIRYRTHDITSLRRVKCKCGRTFIKMDKPTGRSDDMLIVKGVNVFPSQIETVLLEMGYKANYQIVVDRLGTTDTLDVLVEMSQENFSDNLGEIGQMEKDLTASIRTMLGIGAKVRLVAPKSIERNEGKAIRVIDKRKF